MAEKNQVKLTAFEQETIDAAKKVLEYKIASEANVVSIYIKVLMRFIIQILLLMISQTMSGEFILK